MIEVGTVVQLGPNTSNPMFAYCFMQITEPKSWGAQGFVRVPGQGEAYYRAKTEDMVVIGKAAWIAE